jgi:hypothetical protein
MLRVSHISWYQITSKYSNKTEKVEPFLLSQSPEKYEILGGKVALISLPQSEHAREPTINFGDKFTLIYAKFICSNSNVYLYIAMSI